MATKLRFWSLGVAVADKTTDTWEIEVYPIEILPNAEGTLTEAEKLNVTIKDMQGKSVSVSIDKSYTITAEWLPFGHHNRATAPDICRGETVILFRYGGEDKFYWMTMYGEFDLRKKESVMYFFSNKQGVVSEEELPQQGYYLLADTINKKMELHTADNDGEAAQFDLTVDTAAGTITFKDAVDNSVTFDSANNTYTINFQKEVNINSTDKMNLNFKGIAISNGSDELITVLEELLDAIIGEKHLGNLGAPTQLDPGSIAKYNQIKQKITKFKG